MSCNDKEVTETTQSHQVMCR